MPYFKNMFLSSCELPTTRAEMRVTKTRRFLTTRPAWRVGPGGPLGTPWAPKKQKCTIFRFYHRRRNMSKLPSPSQHVELYHRRRSMSKRNLNGTRQRELFALLDLRMSSCIVSILTGEPRRESKRNALRNMNCLHFSICACHPVSFHTDWAIDATGEKDQYDGLLRR